MDVGTLASLPRRAERGHAQHERSARGEWFATIGKHWLLSEEG